jgi:hypothetical protein
MDEKQREQFREALDDKNERDRERAGEQAAAASAAANEEQLADAGEEPDALSVRAKSTGHGKKTADKWNQ